MGEKGNGETSGGTMSTTEPPRTKERSQTGAGTDVDPWDDPNNEMPTPEQVAADPNLGQLGPNEGFHQLEKFGIKADSKAGYRYMERFRKAIGR